MKLTKEDQQEWAASLCTAELKRLLEQAIERVKTDWSFERFAAETCELSCLANAKALGGIDVARQILGVIEDMEQGIYDETN